VILVLWDVDHTLIDNGGVSKETYAAAFEILTGTPATVRARTDGGTDPEIMWDLLQDHGFAPAAHVGRLHEALTAAMLSKADVLRARGRALAGGAQCIAALKANNGIVQSILSGNIRHNALVKLDSFGLPGDLDSDVGAFGSDGNHRPALVKVAQDRARIKYGQEFGKANTWLIGDTVRDVRAGIEGGARVLAVATGVDPIETPRAAGADEAVADLHITDAVVAAVTGRTTGI
jgi:phosphoglycolate phosphatase-like HAD superfamily hydrolase